MKFEKVRKQANFWALGSMACSQFVHTYFCCFLEKFAYFCETIAKSRLAPAGSDWGNWSYGSHVSLFLCFLCVPWFASH